MLLLVSAREEIGTINLTVGKDYGEKYVGAWTVQTIKWKLGRELLRRSMRSKDPTDYIEELIIASVVDPEGRTLTKATLEEMPSGLVRSLMDETLRLNDISRQEANFLQTSPTADPVPSPKTFKSTM